MNTFDDKKTATNHFISVLGDVRKEVESNLHNAKLLFIETIEDSLPDTNNTPLNEINFKEIFDKDFSDFADIYNQIIQLYMDLNQDNLNYTFGEKVDISKDDFVKRLENLENKLQKLK